MDKILRQLLEIKNEVEIKSKAIETLLIRKEIITSTELSDEIKSEKSNRK